MFEIVSVRFSNSRYILGLRQLEQFPNRGFQACTNRECEPSTFLQILDDASGADIIGYTLSEETVEHMLAGENRKVDQNAQ